MFSGTKTSPERMWLTHLFRSTLMGSNAKVLLPDIMMAGDKLFDTYKKELPKPKVMETVSEWQTDFNLVNSLWICYLLSPYQLASNACWQNLAQQIFKLSKLQMDELIEVTHHYL